MKRVSNYEVQCEDWRKRFLGMDQADVRRRVPELREEGAYLTLWHFGRKLGIHRTEGTVSALSDGQPVSVNARMNVYTLLWYARPGARLRGEWVPFGELKNGGPFAPAFQRGVVELLARTLSGHEALLERAAVKLRGERISANGFQLPAFACIPMRLYFWEGDEQISAQANLLFDRSATDFIHVESVVTIASEGLRQLAAAVGLPLPDSAF